MALPSGVSLISEQWRLGGADAGFGASISGRDQFMAGVTPLWTALLGYRVPLIHDPRWLEWEAWLEARRGRLVADDIIPRAARLLGGFAPGIPFEGDILFEGDIAFEPADGFGETIAIGADAAQYATQLAIDPAWSLLPVGKFIWIGGTMHRVATASPGSVSIQPPLRAPVSAGDPIASTGTVPMTLAGATDGALTITGSAHQRVTVALIEEV